MSLAPLLQPQPDPERPSPDQGFQRMRELLRARLGAETVAAWIDPLLPRSLEGGVLRLLAPSRFMAEWVLGNFREPLRQAAESVFGPLEGVAVDVAPAPAAPRAMARAEPRADSPADSVAVADGRPAAFDPRYSFDDFVVGKSNELAFNAAQTLAGAVGDRPTPGVNPLFLYGPTGLGKTHLMHAIGQSVRARLPAARIAYLSAERFMVDYIAALRARDTIAFKQRLRACDLLMIDDVQFIAGKESTQEEFFHTLNEIISAGRWLVISADRSPQNLEGIESRIQSRLAWGLVADINPADYELRLNILKAKLAAIPAASVPDAVIEFLARRIVANVRELEGALNRVIAYANLTGRVVDVDFAREVLADLLRAHSRKLTIDDIQRRVAEHYRLKIHDLVSPRRAREVARPRQVAMYLLRMENNLSLPAIGEHLGGRDHSTVSHGIDKIAAELQRSETVRQAVVHLREQLYLP